MLKYVAAEIASVASNVTGYPTIITDEQGRIIGTDKEDLYRIGQLHEASLDVISTGRQRKHTPEECEELEGTFPGITMPITIHDEVVGSIGIKGDSEEVERYGMLVKMIAEIMLKDRIEAESAHIRHTNLQMLITMIITYGGDNASKAAIINQGKLLGFNLNQTRVPIIVSKMTAGSKPNVGIDLYNTPVYKSIRRQFTNPQDIVVVLGSDFEKYLIFAVADPKQKTASEIIMNKCRSIQNEVKNEYNGDVCIGIGRICNSVETMKVGYERAELVLKAITSGLTDQTIASIIDIPLERMLMEMADFYDGKGLERRIKKILEDKNADSNIELISCWCESMFNFAETARRMDIHKNTLTYRFEKMKENFGIDLHDFKSTIAIYLCIRITRLNSKNGF